MTLDDSSGNRVTVPLRSSIECKTAKQASVLSTHVNTDLDESGTMYEVTARDDIVVPPGHYNAVQLEIDAPAGSMAHHQTLLIEPCMKQFKLAEQLNTDSNSICLDQMPEHFLARPSLQLGQRPHVNALIANVTGQPVHIKKGEVIGKGELVDPELMRVADAENKRMRSKMYDAASGEKWTESVIELGSDDWRQKCSDYKEVIAEVKEKHLDRADKWIEQQIIKVGDKAPQWFRDQLPYLLFAMNEVIAVNPKVPKALVGIEHEFIFTEPPKPYKMKQRRRSPAQNKAEMEQTITLLKNQMIQPSVSPFAAELVLTPKSDGSLRYCVDFRLLNLATEADSMPLIRADDLLDKMGTVANAARATALARGHTESDGPPVLVSSFDCASAFWSCLIRESDGKYTAFNTSLGLMEWLRMPFGLKNSMSTYNRAMQFILRPPLFPANTASTDTRDKTDVDQMVDDLIGERSDVMCDSYVDDCSVVSATGDGQWSDHLDALYRVFRRFVKYGVTIKLSKSMFGATELELVGFRFIANKGVYTSESKITALMAMNAPRTVGEIKTFIGKTSYYRRFVKDFAAIVNPMKQIELKYKTLTTNIERDWHSDPKYQRSFEAIRAAMANAPILRSPDFSKGWIVLSDCSAYQMGAVLCQLGDDGKEYPVAYASASLTDTQQRYGISDRECLAAVWACRTWRHMLYNSPVVLITDHSCLTQLMKKNEFTNQRLARYAVDRSEFDVTIVHRSGAILHGPDALSRFSMCDDPTELRERISNVWKETADLVHYSDVELGNNDQRFSDSLLFDRSLLDQQLKRQIDKAVVDQAEMSEYKCNNVRELMSALERDYDAGNKTVVADEFESRACDMYSMICAVPGTNDSSTTGQLTTA